MPSRMSLGSGSPLRPYDDEICLLRVLLTTRSSSLHLSAIAAERECAECAHECTPSPASVRSQGAISGRKNGSSGCTGSHPTRPAQVLYPGAAGAASAPGGGGGGAALTWLRLLRTWFHRRGCKTGPRGLAGLAPASTTTSSPGTLVACALDSVASFRSGSVARSE